MTTAPSGLHDLPLGGYCTIFAATPHYTCPILVARGFFDGQIPSRTFQERGSEREGGEKMVKVKLIVFMLTSLNLLNWMDRGLIAGAGTLIKGCVEDVSKCKLDPNAQHHCKGDEDDDSDGDFPNIDTCSYKCRVCGDMCRDSGLIVEQTGFGITDFDLGVIQSMFMVGYMGGSFLFSRASHGARVYRILTYGMSVWIVSGLISGSSGFFTEHRWSRYVLMLGRMFSGVGEAALATVALPHLDDILPEEIKGRYLAVYFSAMPVGNALGFVFAGVVSDHLSWKWTFLIEAVMMIPFVLVFAFHPQLQGFRIAQKKRFSADAISVNAASSPTALDESLLTSAEVTRYAVDAHQLLSSEDQAMGQPQENNILWHDIMLCLKSPTFVLCAAGLAMFTFTSAGIAFYMPLFLQAHRPCDPEWNFTEREADEIFGIFVITSGFFGVLVGGAAVDISPVRNYVSHALKFCTVELAVASVLLGMAIPVASFKGFFALAWCGAFIAFASTTPINRAMLGSVPLEARSIAMALSLVIAHLFGDVPSPILIGAMSDAHSTTAALTTAWFGFVVGTVFWIFALKVSLQSLPPDVSGERL